MIDLTSLVIVFHFVLLSYSQCNVRKEFEHQNQRLKLLPLWKPLANDKACQGKYNSQAQDYKYANHFETSLIK
ncbi:hypothetical protein pf16_199 [Pseudomonas phage pf16]|uniref:Uncharacterized protein n=1 Tax=Pseudomonas phage pf16 TaxID=1815630 RepID=A0A1S5R3X2_9CAUD|nr:hypothetical protein FDG98_gp099 [Pseudomonas phage pf16]AND75122.1 hypothetical protein pf16_199 [Pseudomonas phage pf16]